MVHKSLWSCITKVEKDVLEVFRNSYDALRLYGNICVKEIMLIAVSTCDIYNEINTVITKLVVENELFDDGEFKVNNNDTKKKLCSKLGKRFVDTYFNTVMNDFLKAKADDEKMH